MPLRSQENAGVACFSAEGALGVARLVAEEKSVERRKRERELRNMVHTFRLSEVEVGESLRCLMPCWRQLQRSTQTMLLKGWVKNAVTRDQPALIDLL